MKQANFAASVLALSLTAAPATQAAASLEANGFFNGAGETDPSSGTPLPKTVVSVDDGAPGARHYFALADITVPKLAVFGGLDNSGGGALNGGGLDQGPLLFSNATLRDTVTISAPGSDPYIVTAELLVNGTLQVAGSDAQVTAELDVIPVNKLAFQEFRTYCDGGLPTCDMGGPVIHDRLAASYQFSGDAVFDIKSALFFSMHHIDAGANVFADFSNTAIVNIVLTTLAGDPITSFQLNSESGSFGVAPVPLPASLPMLVSALVAVGWKARRRG